MIFLSKLTSTNISVRLVSLSLRSLSVSSNSSPTSRNLICGDHVTQHDFSFSPLIARQNTSLVKDIGNSNPTWRKKEIFDLPLTNKIIENPTLIRKVIEDVSKIENTMNLPDANKVNDENSKQAKNGMIMIRRRKMRKHKLRKLRKKMKFEWAKVRQRREWRKEKVFQAELTAELKEAERFSAEQYVAEKIRKATEPPVPRFWKGKRLPEFIIREKIEEEEQRNLKKKYNLWEKYRLSGKQ